MSTGPSFCTVTVCRGWSMLFSIASILLHSDFPTLHEKSWLSNTILMCSSLVVHTLRDILYMFEI